ncbi:MAG TPA: hypothetical protein DEA55_07220 [Rhodospirillaceae bacterium]|nr:hypothetical protein [Rhodospirillaceae bacterium]
MSREKGISVIIPCYNDGRFITEAVESVYGQKTDIPFEVLIIDDGSTDKKTHEITQSLAAEHSDTLRLIRHKRNKGLPTARNTGLKHAKYPYIFPLDSDDKLSCDPEMTKSGGYLGRAVDVLEENSDVVYAYPGTHLFGAVECKYVFKLPYDEETLLYIHNVGPYVVYRRDEALEIGGYTDRMRYAEDWDFNIAMINGRHKQGRPAEVRQFKEPYILYRRREDGTNMTSAPALNNRQVMQYLIKRSPEIYQKYCPGENDGEILDHALRKHYEVRAKSSAAFALHCVFNPIASFRDGSIALGIHTARRKLHKLWAEHVTDDSPQGQGVQAEPQTHDIV